MRASVFVDHSISSKPARTRVSTADLSPQPSMSLWGQTLRSRSSPTALQKCCRYRINSGQTARPTRRLQCPFVALNIVHGRVVAGFRDDDEFAESFAADVGAEKAAFMADSQMPWGSSRAVLYHEAVTIWAPCSEAATWRWTRWRRASRLNLGKESATRSRIFS
jgi:hypothetical protein